jgi:hypothetical protein
MDYHVHVGLTLKKRVTECWEEISLAELRKSIGSWRKRLRAVCGEDGGPYLVEKSVR